MVDRLAAVPCPWRERTSSGKHTAPLHGTLVGDGLVMWKFRPTAAHGRPAPLDGRNANGYCLADHMTPWYADAKYRMNSSRGDISAPTADAQPNLTLRPRRGRFCCPSVGRRPPGQWREITKRYRRGRGGWATRMFCRRAAAERVPTLPLYEPLVRPRRLPNVMASSFVRNGGRAHAAAETICHRACEDTRTRGAMSSGRIVTQ